MTGRDWVALVLALAISVILVIIAWGVVIGGFQVTGEGAIGAIIGAMAVGVVRYLADRNGHAR